MCTGVIYHDFFSHSIHPSKSIHTRIKSKARREKCIRKKRQVKKTEKFKRYFGSKGIGFDFLSILLFLFLFLLFSSARLCILWLIGSRKNLWIFLRLYCVIFEIKLKRFVLKCLAALTSTTFLIYYFFFSMAVAVVVVFSFFFFICFVL